MGSQWFLQFCKTYGFMTTFPVSERILLYFIAHLHKAGLTLKSYLHTEISLGSGIHTLERCPA